MLSSWHEAAQAGLSHGSTAWEENLPQRSPALLLPHQLLPCTTQPPSLGISWQHLPSLAAPFQTQGTQRVPSAQHSLGFIFIYYYSLLLFIYSLLFLFHFEHAQLCHLGFAENVNKKKKEKKNCIQMQPFIA